MIGITPLYPTSRVAHVRYKDTARTTVGPRDTEAALCVGYRRRSSLSSSQVPWRCFFYRSVIEPTIAPEAVTDSRRERKLFGDLAAAASRRKFERIIRELQPGIRVPRHRIRRGHPCSSFSFGRDRPIGDGRKEERKDGASTRRNRMGSRMV